MDLKQRKATVALLTTLRHANSTRALHLKLSDAIRPEPGIRVRSDKLVLFDVRSGRVPLFILSDRIGSGLNVSPHYSNILDILRYFEYFCCQIPLISSSFPENYMKYTNFRSDVVLLSQNFIQPSYLSDCSKRQTHLLQMKLFRTGLGFGEESGWSRLRQISGS